MTEEHKEQIAKWLRAAPTVRGTLLRGIRFPDQTFVNEGPPETFPASALEQVWRVAADTFQVLSAQRFPATRLSWVYERAVIHCAQRIDGAVLGVFFARKTSGVDPEGLTRLLNEFQGLALAHPTPQTESK